MLVIKDQLSQFKERGMGSFLINKHGMFTEQPVLALSKVEEQLDLIRHQE
jgi:hypothetical protein